MDVTIAKLYLMRMSIELHFGIRNDRQAHSAEFKHIAEVLQKDN